MCSEYQTKITPKEIEKALGVSMLNSAKNFAWGQNVKAFNKDPQAPVIVKNANEEIELTTKIFPVSPFPNSRLSGLEGQTDAADKDESDGREIKRIYETARWKLSFAKSPCLVAMSEFTEFAYWGPEKGKALAFKIPDEDVLFAAGIGIKPFRPAGEPNSAFSILTHTATTQMHDYHQRLIVLFRNELALGFLDDMTPKERFEYAIENRYTGKLEVRELRKMAGSYKTRIPIQVAKLNREREYRQVLKAEGVRG